MKSALHLNAKATVSSKGQVVIPRILREALGLHHGSELLFEIQRNGTLSVKPVKRNLEMFFGRCHRDDEPVLSQQDVDLAIAQAVLENDEKAQ